MTGEVKTESTMQQRPGVCRGFATKGEPADERRRGMAALWERRETGQKHITYRGVLEGKAL